jgi:hypothetical protein
MSNYIHLDSPVINSHFATFVFLRTHTLTHTHIHTHSHTLTDTPLIPKCSSEHLSTSQ